MIPKQSIQEKHFQPFFQYFHFIFNVLVQNKGSLLMFQII